MNRRREFVIHENIKACSVMSKARIYQPVWQQLPDTFEEQTEERVDCYDDSQKR